MSAKLQNMPTNWVDPDDAPELTDTFFELADEYQGKNLIRLGRPPLESPKKLLSVRFDVDVIDAFKKTGKGWQTRMNDALKEYIARH